MNKGGVMKIRRHRRVRRRAVLLVLGFPVLSVLSLSGIAFGGRAEQAPRRPPEPFAVFVHASDPEDPELRVELEKAVPVIRDRVRRRKNWLTLAASAEAADIVLRVSNYRMAQVMHPKLDRLFVNGRATIVERSEVVEFHYVDAVALAGEIRENLTGLDERDTGAGLRNAASHLAEELERFCKDNYTALRPSR